MSPPRLSALVVCVLLGGCNCNAPGLLAPHAEDLQVAPAALQLPPAYVGQPTRGTVSVDNLGGLSVTVNVFASPPFSADADQLVLAKGQGELISVEVTPTGVGPLEGTLTVGPHTISLSTEGLAVPECRADPCQETHFDFALGQCTSAQRADGAACETRCVVAGQCASGSCVGTLNSCDDVDACTVDACSEADGCSHSPLRCPAATNPCQVAACDPLRGCGLTDADDGTLCGPDDCLAQQVQVCLSGQCVARARPAQARCSNTWVPTTLYARRVPAVAYDSVRQRVLLFGGYSGINSLTDTWEWDGARWSMRTPPTSPPPMYAPVMVWDSGRSRMVLVGDAQGLSQTWEWDGVTWLERDSAHSLPARSGVGLAYDAARRRVVLFGGYSGGNLAETWEWDGQRWEQKTPATQPSARSSAAMAWDEDRQRVVLFGGLGLLADTWEWDGVTWLRRAPAVSPPRRTGRMAWNGARHRVVLFGGEGSTSLGDLWEWDGTTWQEQLSSGSTPARSEHGLAWDSARGELVVVGGSLNGLPLADTWVWSGGGWLSRTPTAPEVRTYHAMAFDEVRQRVVLFGGVGGGLTAIPAHTWEWDGTSWSRSATTGPSSRMGHAMTWDPLRQRVVLFGGRAGIGGPPLADTWEWDGVTWLQRSPSTSPPARSHFAMTFDSGRGRVLITGGSTAPGVTPGEWEWDGTTWSLQSLRGVPVLVSHAMTFDETAQQVTLLNGPNFAPATWVLAATWEQRSPLTTPPQGTYAMAYDRLRHRVVVLGARSTETWEWDGTDWAQRQPGASPPSSQFINAMVFDGARQRLMITGESGPWVFLP